MRERGLPTPTPTWYEDDPAWIGAPFIVMAAVGGSVPDDVTYARKGWLHDAPAHVQRRVHDEFFDVLARLSTVGADSAPWLARPGGVGLGPEIDWWDEYLRWATDLEVPGLMGEAFAWLRRTRPDDRDLCVSWGDARLSNAVYADDGRLAGVLDWEQACVCPPECDLGWWLATRRQAREMARVASDPELPGFEDRATVIRRFETVLDRPLDDIEWFESFAMIRMACCVLSVQRVLRASGRADSPLMLAPLMPEWTIGHIRAV